MKKSSLVKLSLATVVVAVALSVIPNQYLSAKGDAPSHLVWDGSACSKNTLSQCAPGS